MGNIDQPMHLSLMLKPVDWNQFIRDCELPLLWYSTFMGQLHPVRALCITYNTVNDFPNY